MLRSLGTGVVSGFSIAQRHTNSRALKAFEGKGKTLAMIECRRVISHAVCRATTVLCVVGFCLMVVLSVGGLAANAAEDVRGSSQHGYGPHTGIEKGKFWLDARYRYEHVNQEFFSEPARASTLRLRPGIETGFFYGFRAGIEGDFVMEIGPDDFNNTINGRTDRPVVVDVKSGEVNQAYIESHHVPGVVLKGGRYRLNLDNWRFVGSVVWRQNDQTFDGGTMTVTAIPGVKVFYGYAGNVNRIFSNRAPDGRPNDGDLTSNIHLINVKSDPLPYELGTVTGYTYLMDMMDFDRFSNASYGGFWKGKRKLFDGVSLNYYFEYAFQTDYADHPLDYSANYLHIAPGLSVFGLTATFGYEKLGSDDGLVGFQTPLATGHKFNGFADVFLATPAAGLRDTYVDLTYKVKDAPEGLSFFNGLLVKAQYHEFRSDVGDVDYGHEFDLYVKQPIYKGLFADFKYANYQADNFATDREKIIFGLGYKY